MKLFFMVLGIICLAMGTVGVIIPILPTTPFYLVATFCFAKSSERLNRWFISTRLYRKHLESFTTERAMLKKTKLSIMATVTAVIVAAFILMDGLLVGQLILVAIWLLHMLYFLFRVKTLDRQDRE